VYCATAGYCYYICNPEAAASQTCPSGAEICSLGTCSVLS
jgi:hypothetical protein